MRDVRLLLNAIAAGFLACAAMYGQFTTGTIYGTVRDPSNASIPGVALVARNEGTGLTLTTVSDSVGAFTFHFLAAGSYTLTLTAKGFRPMEQRGMEVAVGQKLNLDLRMELGDVTTAVEVSAAPPLVNSVSAQVIAGANELAAKELPLLKRDITSLFSLAAGVNPASEGARINGLPPGSANITLDGLDANRDPEKPNISTYQNFSYIKGASVEAISEVQVVKNIFSAELANTMAGGLNVVTKSGTNELHGSAFENYQSKGLNAREPFAATRNPLVFHQFGGSLGGPLRKDKLFVFGAYEGYRQTNATTLVLDVPTAESRSRAIAANPAYKRIVDLYPDPNQPARPGAATAQLIAPAAGTMDENHEFVRSDYLITPYNTATVRYIRFRPNRLTPTLLKLPYDRLQAGRTDSVGGSFFHTKASWSLETRYGWSKNDLDRINGDIEVGRRGDPAITATAAGIQAGFNELFSKRGSSNTLEEIIALNRGRHSIKTGAIYQRQTIARLGFQSANFQYSSVNSFVSNTPDLIAIYGYDDFFIPRTQLGFFIQDDFRVNSRLVLNLGLRYDYWTVVKERSGNLYNRDPWYGPFRPADSIYDADRNNFAPRLGFAYKLDQEGKTVLRGGVGQAFFPIVLFELLNLYKSAPDALGPTSRLTRDDALRFGFRFPMTNKEMEDIVKKSGGLNFGLHVDPRVPTSSSIQYSFGIDRQLTRSMAWEVHYVGNVTRKLIGRTDLNRPDRVTGLRPRPDFVYIQVADGVNDSSNYNSLQTTLRKRFSQNLQFETAYTWAKGMNYTGGDFGSVAIQDNNNIRGEKGRLAIPGQRFVTNWVYELPLASLLPGDGRVRRLLAQGWQIAGIVDYQSGVPFNITQAGSLPTRPDIVVPTHEAAYVRSGLQWLSRDAFAKVPLSTASGAGLRPGNLGRFALSGPRTGAWNLALSKSLKLTERIAAQLRVDMFNAFNNVNYGNRLNLNLDSSAFGRFTGTEAPRNIQLNGRLTL
jgi:hypothetical protein